MPDEHPTDIRIAGEQPAIPIGTAVNLGRDTTRSKTTLAHLEEMRRLHVADRDRLLQALREFGE